MDRGTAEKLIELAKAAKADLWFKRSPTPEMIARFGEQGLHPFIEQRKQKGEPTGVEVLAEDYSGDDELRNAHIDFILASAASVVELAEFFLERQTPLDRAFADSVEKNKGLLERLGNE
jgi:hypothetical protein